MVTEEPSTGLSNTLTGFGDANSDLSPLARATYGFAQQTNNPTQTRQSSDFSSQHYQDAPLESFRESITEEVSRPCSQIQRDLTPGEMAQFGRPHYIDSRSNSCKDPTLSDVEKYGSQVNRDLTAEELMHFGSPPCMNRSSGSSRIEPTLSDIEKYGSQINRDLTPEEMAQFGTLKSGEDFIFPGPNELRHRPNVYKDGYFYPMHIGDIFKKQYIVLAKLGWGGFSTVWLIRDVYKQRCYALKVLSTECYGTDNDIFEIDVLEHLRDFQIDHPGMGHVSQLVDKFWKRSPCGQNGVHFFLVFDLMAETLHTFRFRFANRQVPPKLLKKFARQLLLALDYSHKAGVIHTDLKPDNIMIQLPGQNIIDNRWRERSPMRSRAPLRHTELSFLYWPNDTRERMRRENNVESLKILPTELYPPQGMSEVYLDPQPKEEDLLALNVIIGDWGLASWTDNHLCDKITAPALRSPECIIRAPWNTKTDIWTLGAVLLELLIGCDIFSNDENDSYDLKQHIHGITSIFGRFPRSLLLRGRRNLVNSMFGFYGDLQGSSETSSGTSPIEWCLKEIEGFGDQDDKRNFFEMIKNMMRIDPDERSSAEDLLKEPWLQDGFSQSVDYPVEQLVPTAAATPEAVGADGLQPLARQCAKKLETDEQESRELQEPSESSNALMLEKEVARKQEPQLLTHEYERMLDEGKKNFRDLEGKFAAGDAIKVDKIAKLQREIEAMKVRFLSEGCNPLAMQPAQLLDEKTFGIKKLLSSMSTNEAQQDEFAHLVPLLTMLVAAVVTACPLESSVLVGIGMAAYIWCKVMQSIYVPFCFHEL